MSYFFLNNKEDVSLRRHIIAFLVLICLVVWLAIQSIAPKQSLISSEHLRNAQTDLARISAARHPVGSVAHQQVREFLVERLEKMGLKVEQQNSFAINPRNNSAAQVQNLMIKLGANSGQGPAKTILVAAHYDSVANSYGAGDDGVSIANMLQVITQLQQQKRQNDILFLMTDAEENGLLGAITFAEQHPWSKDIALVLNFDNRGNSGPIMMFETSNQNGKLIQHLAQATPKVVSNSIMYEVYKALPNDTDFTVFRKQGIAGLNFAMIDNFSSYHTHHDTAQELNPASLAEQQQLMRDLLQHFAQQDLQQLKTENHVYFSLPGLGFVHYSNTLANVFSALIILGLVLILILQVRWQRRHDLPSQTLRLRYTVFASILFLLQLAILGFLGQRAWIFICRLYPEYATLRDADNGHFYLLAFILFFATVFTYTQRWLCRWWRPIELQIGAYLIWAILLAVTTVLAPGLSFLFAWPLSFVLLAKAWQLKQTDMSSLRLFWLNGIVLLPAIVLFAPLILLFNIALGMRMSGVPIGLSLLVLGLAIPTLLPIATQLRRWIPLLFVKICIVAAAVATANYHKAFPEPTQLMYVSGAQAGENYWASPNENLNSELVALFGQTLEYKHMEHIVGPHSRYSKFPLWHAKTSQRDLAKPVIQVQQVRVVDRHLLVQVKVDSPLFANHSFFALEGSKVFKARINGQDFVSQDPDHWSILIHGRNQVGNAMGNLLELEIEAGSAAKLRVIDSTYQSFPDLRTSSDFMAMSIATLDIH